MVLAAAGAMPSAAQSLLQSSTGGAMLVSTDLAVLEARDARTDLACAVSPIKPTLGFDLRFHAGFDFSVPLAQLSGSENLLTIIFRVTSEEKQDEPVYLVQRVRVPAIEEDAKGSAQLQGSFDVGEGKYKVDWLMRDRSERVCASFWDIEAALAAKDKGLAMNLVPGQVTAPDKEEFAEEPVVTRQVAEGGLNVKVLVNFAPQQPNAASLQPADTTALVTILRSIMREPRFTRFSVVAFNHQEQKVLYRQQAADRIDFPAIGEALKDLQLGRVHVEKLQQKHSAMEFLKELIQSELKKGDEAVDAVIIAGPKAMLEENVPVEALRTVGEPEFPLFYLNVNLNPQQTPWRDTIGQAVHYFKGQEFAINRPRDLWFAVSEMVGKIVKLKHGKRSATAPGGSSHAVAYQ